MIDGEWDYSYTGYVDHPILNNLDPAKLAKMIPLAAHPSIVKVLFLTAKELDRLEEKLAALDLVIHKHRNEQILDISPKDVHKWAALRKLGYPQRKPL